MNESGEILSLKQALAACHAHRTALEDALSGLDERKLSPGVLEAIGKQDHRLLDQFAYRYTRLQDDMGARLLPAVLKALGEDIAAMPVLDRLNRLEQLEWLPSADEWMELRRVRNEFTHEYPESFSERFERLQLAMTSARRLIEILNSFTEKVAERW